MRENRNRIFTLALCLCLQIGLSFFFLTPRNGLTKSTPPLKLETDIKYQEEILKAVQIDEFAEDQMVDGIPNASVERMQVKLDAENFERWLSITKCAGTPESVDLLKEVVKSIKDGVVHRDLFHALFPFSLDGFQLEALSALGKRKNVIVSAPTGSGKTVAGELAIYYALALGLRVFYTSPLKALSNQKFKDFQNQFGKDRVGLLTGDTSINRDAQVCVMTTEVFRNMLYEEDEELLDVFAVVFDEFHYMNDPERGTVWEESVMNCPPHMLMVALSATMRNVDQIADWFSYVHGPSQLICSNFRPVPLSYYYATNIGIQSLFQDPKVGPGAPKGVLKPKRNRGLSKKDKTRKRSDPMRINPHLLKENKRSTPRITPNMSPRDIRRAERASINREIPSGKFLIRCLNRANMLPAIVFIFSRVGCDKSVQECIMNEESWLLSEEEVAEVDKRVEEFSRLYPQIPLEEERVMGLRQGIGAHHAGLLPAYKSLIEDLFNSNLIKVLFATETLSAGVNMPARSTVISILSKRTNNGIETLAPSSLLQMAGRAGRRGKDTAGSVVIVRSRFEDARDAHKLLLSPIDSIKSHFRASYGLVSNVLKSQDLEKAQALVKLSFGNFVTKGGSQDQEIIDAQEELEQITLNLQELDLNQVKIYRKLWERLCSEQRIEQYLLSQIQQQDQDLIDSILPYAQLGTGLLLRSGESAVLVGDCPFLDDYDDRKIVVLTDSGKLKIVHFKGVRMYDVGDNAGLDVSKAKKAGDKIPWVSNWAKKDKDVWVGELSEEAFDDELRKIASEIPVVDQPAVPGHIIKQKEIVKQVENELKSNPIHFREDKEQILEWAKDINELEVKMRQGVRIKQYSDQPAWDEFLAVCEILQKYNALQDYKPTEFGKLVGSINSDNELWLALILTHPNIDSLSTTALAGLMPSVINEYSRKDQFILYGQSEEVENFVEELLPMAQDLVEAQLMSGVMFPVRLDPTYSGLVESWVSGCSWSELCESCSLDQGDLCRILRRTNEVLKQILNLPLVSNTLKDKARAASNAIDRFPVADDITYMAGGKETETISISGMKISEMSVDE